MFEEMTKSIRSSITRILSHIEIKSNVNESINERKDEATNNNINLKKIPRNSKCPCGSGKKYKNCCGKI